MEQLPETNPQLSSCPRGKTFTSLLDLSLYGLNKSTRFPGYQVYNMINVFVVIRLSVMNLCSITTRLKQHCTGERPVHLEQLEEIVSRKEYR